MCEMDCTTLLLALFIVYCVYRLHRRRFENLIERFPGPYSLPLVGNVLSALESREGIFKKLEQGAAIYSSPVRIWLFNQPVIFIFDPENFQMVSNKAFHKGKLNSFVREIMGDGLITIECKNKWKSHKRLVSPAFNMRDMQHHYFKVFDSFNVRLLEAFDKIADTGNAVNIWPFVFKNEYQKVAKALMNYDFESHSNHSNSLKFEKYYGLLKICYQNIMRRMMNPLWLLDFINSIYDFVMSTHKILDELHRFPYQIMDEYAKYLKSDTDNVNSDSESNNILIKLLMGSEGQRKYADQLDLSYEIITFLETGSTTIPTTVCFTLLMLAMHPEQQDLTRTEIDRVFGTDDSFDSQKLDQLTHLDMCVKETLRLFPSAPYILRKSNEDLMLKDGRIIPAGVELVLPIFLMHKNPLIYPEPNRWDPSRFTPENIATRHPSSYAPFGLGPRKCIGYKYAYLSIKTLVISVLRKFRVTTDMKLSDIKLNFNIALMNMTGFHICFHRLINEI